MAQPKRQSRGQRWLEASETAEQALTTLEEIRQEYQDWRDNLPENLENSPTAEKLDTLCDLDIQGALDTINDAVGAELPRGFGRE